MQREQKTAEAGCSCEGRVETESNKRAQSTASPDNAERIGVERVSLLAKVLESDNLNEAVRRVEKNGGAPGTDGMTVKQMRPYLMEHGKEIVDNIRSGKYKPQPVRRVEIPKPDGGVRLLGVPTVIDRMIQQAIVQVLQPIFEPTFSDSSYGFRPNRNAHQAIRRAKAYIEEGYEHVVDIDLAKYFDTVNHDILISAMRKVVKDEELLRVVRRFLQSGVMKDGIVSPTTEGTPQGGNLSPLLSNIYLTSFDRLLEERGLKFVRYADDCNIYVKSNRAAERVMEACTRYLEGKLRLKVNREKSKVGSPMKLKFLGFSFYKLKGKIRIRIHKKPLEKFKEKIRELTKRNRGVSLKRILYELKKYTTGWLGYYRLSDAKSVISGLNEWIRRRLRMYVWKQWKRVRTRFDKLQFYGIAKLQAWEWANTRKGYWRTANSPILNRTLTNKYLVSQGYDDIANRYEVLHSSC